ncbi:probable polypeptide N-acetylgalactosaminyltransferase 8 [Cyprinodon tularosa]|uniref:probable polypeptide N-acetylgalactosaminyltransferase 8 n=1 Tax=Cyprinodon tularosa TaxID=77115 RepID=UPI0018E1E89E|nr:probable polypeptide N-acetylgalactosaminyltransferase 8 [Cyprinodon tularosa]
MKVYFRVGVIGAFLFLMYIFISITGKLGVKKLDPIRIIDQEDISRKLDRIEETLNKLAKFIDKPSQKISNEVLPPNKKKEKPKNPVSKLYPNSFLFTKWGDDLSEEEQKEAEALFQIYGYNAFLSNRIPLDRKLPDMRDPRCLKRNYPKDLPSISVVLIYVNEALSVIKRAVCSIITHTPKHLLKEIILVDDHSTYSKFGFGLTI